MAEDLVVAALVVAVEDLAALGAAVPVVGARAAVGNEEVETRWFRN